MKLATNKIPCFVIVFHDIEIIRRSLEFLTAYSDRLDIVVIENHSEHTDKSIKPYITSLLESGVIAQYFLFSRNITNNAYEVALEHCQTWFSGSPYIMITDGDLVVENNPNWLDEEIQILQRHSDVFACAVSLAIDDGVQVETYPDVRPGNSNYEETADYFVADTGVWLNLFRTQEFLGFMNYRAEKEARFTDHTLRKYGRVVLGKKWARTKISETKHLTLDRYRDSGSDYMKVKQNKSFRELWQHYRYCPYTLYTSAGARTYFPWRKMLHGFAVQTWRELSLILRRDENG